MSFNTMHNLCFRLGNSKTKSSLAISDSFGNLKLCVILLRW